ncbi:MAG: bifunctional nuclease family protein [Actinobacteria bacterium]|nr:bifunctional nuclease family protein [Actinomycetota bacterium]
MPDGSASSNGGYSSSPTDSTFNPSLPPGNTFKVVVVTNIIMELPSSYPSLWLRELEPPWRDLRIPIGMAEGIAIAYAWKHIETPRPLTHQLFARIQELFDIQLEVVRIKGMEGQNFIAELVIVGPDGRQEVVDCRPSDAIAMALRQTTPTPILVAESILAQSRR